MPNGGKVKAPPLISEIQILANAVAVATRPRLDKSRREGVQSGRAVLAE